MKRNRRKLGSWILAAVMTFAGVSVAYAQGSWSSLAPLPVPTEGLAIGGVGQVIVAAYGFSVGDTNLTWRYNISNNSWTPGALAPLPPRSEVAYGERTHGGFFYVAGGRFIGVLPNLERYDPVTDTWTSLAPMPTPRAGAAIAPQDDSLFVIGGRTSPGGPCTGPALTAVERYDIDTGTWSSVAPLPSPRSDLAAQTHGGKIYVFGGCNGPGAFTNEVDVYDPVKNTWTVLSPMPTARASLTAGKVGQRIYAIGGWAGGPPLNINEVYNVAQDSWSTAAPMTTPRGEMGSHSHGGRVYVVGGGQPAFGTPTAANEVFKANP